MKEKVPRGARLYSTIVKIILLSGDYTKIDYVKDDRQRSSRKQFTQTFTRDGISCF